VPSSTVLDMLASARQVAVHAERLGVVIKITASRPAFVHLGAALADAILQAGLNYRTIVKPRIDRIEQNYPCAANLSGLKAIVENGLLGEFLLWTHPVKISRFTQLVALLGAEGVDNTTDLREWLEHSEARDKVLSLAGLGPKTHDYLCCLVGIDRIAVDRHIKTFAREAGVLDSDYHDLQAIVSCAADLLGLRRRDFDAWIWGRRQGRVRTQTACTTFEPSRHVKQM